MLTSVPLAASVEVGSLPPFAAFAQQKKRADSPERPLSSRGSFDLALAAKSCFPSDVSNGHVCFGLGAAVRHHLHQ
jgi:hypothetical protein